MWSDYSNIEVSSDRMVTDNTNTNYDLGIANLGIEELEVLF
jgi:hypothetical protein